MKRYKLVRIVEGEFHSANTEMGYGGLKYKVGHTTKAKGRGIACYKTLSYVDRPNHIRETMDSFNGGNPIAILEVKSIGNHTLRADTRYQRGMCYEGGVNYPAVHVVRVVKTIRE